MQIKLNVINNGSCAQIYVLCEPEEKPWLNFKAVKLWHNSTRANIVGMTSFPDNFDNDCYVSFVSKVSFESFCSRFAESEYGQSVYYQFLNHNCAHGAHFALQLAGIDVPLSSMQSMCFSSSIPLPGPVLTPLGLFYQTKKYKTELLQPTDSEPLKSIPFRFQLASNRLLFWAKTASSDKRNEVHALLSEISKRIEKRPWHAEHHIDTLVKIIDLLMHDTIENQATDFTKLASAFKERNRFLEEQFTYIGTSGLIWLKLFMFFHNIFYNFEQNCQFTRSLLMKTLIGTQNEWLILIPYFLLMSAAGAYDICHPPRSAETVLYRAIKNLTDAGQYTDADEQYNLPRLVN
ncbi:hypothetical protein Lqui_0152 [Legionella quinlivanii]|uniref:Uncharacterized protein n=1 Tax=Legionella quinlivanii TaxID=45073 RepID=A0A0W0Y6V4_9GAMM|nr:hypothetical protein [Legionella quinlivanii]KTD52586.1 hypothetical protein Lqui_0152 [Legionella quinlivanii]MCW8449714.1 hypothetical protein [Legionella quinlivanii]SEF71372.1 hypothetical protein SAMN02746093_00839 [Legionella quinlivanii DSM 21216]STY12135.1 Uncharacterised protein [Legionella quinlivanii]